MPIARIPLASKIESRTYSLAKDAYSKNCYFETRDKHREIIKRPGSTTVVTSLPNTQAQGLYSSLQYLWAACNSTLYKVTPSTNTSTSFGSIGSGFVYFNQTSQTAGYTVLQDGSNVFYVAPAASSVSSVASGTIFSYTINTKGDGYTSVPTATVTGGGGSSATANVFLGVVAISGITAGTGYVVNDIVSFALTGGTATAEATFIVTAVSGTGAITAITTQVQGTYSVLPTLYGVSTPVALTGGTGSSATATLFWGVTSVTPNAVGSGYTAVPTVTITAPAAGGTNASAIANVSYAPIGPFATGLVYIDGYLVVATKAGRLYSSGIDDPTTWNALDFITAEAEPDPLVGIAKHFNYVIAFGQWSTEFFYDVGTSTGSPFGRNDAARLEVGCANGGSIVQIEQSVIWVGKSREHGNSVYIMDGFTPVSISTPYIEKYLNADTSDSMRAYAFKIEGHTFYVMTLHSLGITFVYDVNEKEWYNWTYMYGGSEVYFRPSFYAEYNNTYYAMDDDHSFIVTLSTSVYTDSGAAIQFGAVTSIMDSGSMHRKFYRRVEAVGDKITGTLQISHSNDDYVTWSNPRSVDLSVERPVLYQCGADRRRAWKFSNTDPVPLRLSAIELDYEMGHLEGQTA